MEKVKGNKRYELPVMKQISHGDVMYNLNINIVNNAIMTLCRSRCLLDLLGDHTVR